MEPILLGQLLRLFSLACVWLDSWRPRPGSLGREASSIRGRGGWQLTGSTRQVEAGSLAEALMTGRLWWVPQNVAS